MWDLPRPGLEPVCPAFAGRLSTTAAPGKPSFYFYNMVTEKFPITYVAYIPFLSDSTGLECHYSSLFPSSMSANKE